MKNQNIDNSCTYSSISNIKDWSEEDKMIAPNKRKPVGKVSINQWKVEHIDNLSLKKTRISSLKNSRYLPITFRKNHAIKSTINHIANSTSKNKGYTINNAFFNLSICQFKPINTNGNNGNYSKNT